MKLTPGLIEKLTRLKAGESVPSSQLKGEWVNDLLRDRLLICISNGSHKSYKVSDADSFLTALERIHEGLGNLESMRSILSAEQASGDASRAEQAAETGNSKLRMTRSFPGFLVNSYEPILCVLEGNSFTICPNSGSASFVFDWKSFHVPADVIIVGIENPENFRQIRKQRSLFEGIYPGKQFLFVSRYPQSKDLRKWLQSIPNHYVHFGDFDLAGIKIFLSEFHSYIPERSSFMIPKDIEDRLRLYGSQDRFNGNYYENRNICSDIPELQSLINLILKYHKCYDQEGYIEL